MIANADGGNEEIRTVFAREAVLALLGTDGLVPGGRVGDDLLEDDPAAPFGRRLDLDAVAAAFDDAWVDRSVVLVEASDLARADTYPDACDLGPAGPAAPLALERSDALLGRLLDRVDPGTDAVLVVGPYPASGSDHLTIAALRAPGLRARPAQVGGHRGGRAS